MKLAFYLVYIFGGSTPVYGRRNEVVGRTHYISFFKGQAMRLPDDSKKRVEVVDAVRLSSDAITMPVMHIVVEDENGAISAYDPSIYDLVRKDRVGNQTQDKVTTPQKTQDAAQRTGSATPASSHAGAIKARVAQKPKKKVKAKKSSKVKRDIEAEIKILIEANGRLTADQMSDFLAEPVGTILAYTKDPDKFIRDGDFYTINPDNK